MEIYGNEKSQGILRAGYKNTAIFNASSSFN